eukprot:2946861-Prymnesium_polylepis.1
MPVDDDGGACGRLMLLRVDDTANAARQRWEETQQAGRKPRNTPHKRAASAGSPVAQERAAVL